MNRSVSESAEIILPDALHSRDEVGTEWWYYDGYLESGGRVFAFHLAFFRQRTDGMTIGRIFPLRWIGAHVRCAHFALTDLAKRRFHYGQRKSLRANAGAASDRYHVWMEDWEVQGFAEHHQLRVKVRNVELILELDAIKSAVLHPYGGIFSTGGAGESFHFSYPRMSATGALFLEGQRFPVAGQAWFDRESGRFHLDDHRHGWDWFGMQFEDDQELMVYRMLDDQGLPTEHSTATVIDAGDDIQRLTVDQFEVIPLETWQSPWTGNAYPVRWHIESPTVDADLLVEAYLRFCEMDSRPSTSLIYWEGPARVHGRLRGRKVQGNCFVELVGYDRRTRRLGVYDFASNNLTLLGFLANECRLRLFGPGCTMTDN